MRALLVLALLCSFAVVANHAAAQQQYPQQQYQQQPPPGYPQNQGVYLNPQGGYATMQVPPQIVAMQQELAMQQERYASFSTGGPVAIMIIGFVTFVISGLFWVGFALDDSFSSRTYTRWETTASGVISLVGLAAGFAGIGWLIATTSERAPYGRRIRELKQQLNALGVMASLPGLTITF